MDITRNKFSNTVCVLFSVSILALFCLTNKVMLGLNNVVSCAIIAAALCGLVAFISILVNRLVNKFGSNIRVDGNLVYIIAISFVSLVFVVIRLLMISNIIEVPLEIGAVYDNAKICADGNINMNFSTAGGILSSLISVFIRFLGNTSLPIIIVQFILSAGAYVLLLFGVKNLLGRVSSFFVCVFAANLPVFFKSIASDRIDNLALLAFAFFIFLCGKYKKRLEYYDAKVILSLLIGLLSGILSLYDRAFLLTFVIPIVVICSNSDETTSNKIFNSVGIVFGNLLGFFVPIVIENFLVGSGDVIALIDSVSKSVMSRLGFCNNIGFMEKMVSDPWISLTMLLCVFYCVYFWKTDEDNGHIIAIFFVLISLQLCFTKVNYSSEYTMIYVVCLAAIAGYGFSKIGYDPGYSSVTKIEDDMQPAIVQMIGTKVVASEEEINKAFSESAEKEKKSLAEKTMDNKSDIEQTEKKSTVDLTLRAEEINAHKEPEVKEEAEVKAEPEVKAETEVKAEPQVKVETEVKADASVQAEPEVKAEPEVQAEPEEEYVPQERKYTEPEVRKTSDFGMNDVSFESLFAGTNLPPKSARKDVFDEYFEEVDENTGEIKEEQLEEESLVTEEFSFEEESVIVEEPKPVEEPVIIEEPKPVEEPVIVEEPKPVEEPVVEENKFVEEPVAMEEPFRGFDFDNNEQKSDVSDEKDSMNSADFASLFAGTNIPPKFARNDLYDEYYDETDTTSEEPEQTVEEPETIEETQQDEKVGEALDKKAYVDTFFSYLYDESVFDQPIEMPEHKEPEEQQYVSNASKFADLDLDLGIDAFDYVPEGGESAEETQDSSASEETEVVVEEAAVEQEVPAFEEPEVEEETVAEQEMPVIENVEEQLLAQEVSFFDEEPVETVEENTEFSEEPLMFDEEPVSMAEEQVSIAEEQVSFTEDAVAFTEEPAGIAEETKTFAEVPMTFAEDSATALVEQADMLNDQAEDLLESASFTEEFLFIDSNEEYKESEQPKAPINIEEEFDFDEVIPSYSDAFKEDGNGWDSIDRSSFELKPATSGEGSLEDEIYNALADMSESKEQEVSIEEELLKKLNASDDFSYEEAIGNRLAEEELAKQNGFSYEEALEKKLDVEESIKRAEEKIDFSVEESLNNKLILEESIASGDGNVSMEEVLAKKIEVEEEYNNNIADDGFSFTEALEQKIDLENNISAEMNRSIIEKIEVPEQIDEFVFEDNNPAAVGFEESVPAEESISFEESMPVEESISFEESVPMEDGISFEESVPSDEGLPVPEEEKKPVELIENPLPLPKKHVHRELDYGRSVPENWMHYDVKIDNKNDFFDI